MLYEFDQQQLQSLAILNPAEQTDEELMARIQAGDEAALTVLHQRHTGLLRTIMAKVVHNDRDVDELLGDLLLEIWNRADTYDSRKGKVLGWVITMARRRAIDKVRRHQAYSRAEERLRLTTDQDPRSGWYQGGEDETSANDRTEIFQELLKGLPEAQAEVVRLAYYNGLSQREIAARTRVPLGTVKTRLELGVQKLRTAILAIGGAEDWLVTH